MLPNFLIPGFPKTGTFTLYDFLKQHPDVLMSKIKEPQFFWDDSRWEKGIEYYESFFNNYNGEKAVGEASIPYVIDTKCLDRIKKTLPDVKLIFSLRDPVERAYSHYWYDLSTGGIESDSFDDVVFNDKFRHIIKFSSYYTLLKPYIAAFSEEQLFFHLMEDLRESPEEQMRKIFSFLEVDVDFKINVITTSNKTYTKKNRKLNDRFHRFKNSRKLKKTLPSPVYRLIFNNLYDTLIPPLKKPKMSSRQIEELKKILAPEVEGISEILGFRPKNWKHFN